MFSRFFDTYLRVVIHFPKTVLMVLLALAIFLALGLPNFKLDASADSMTLEHDTDLDVFREVSSLYSSGDFLVVTFKPEQELFSDASLETLNNLKKELAQVDGVASINSILNVPLLFSPKLALSEIAKEPRTLLDEGVDRTLAREEFWNSPIYKNLILGPDGQTTAMQLNLAVDQTFMDLVSERDRLRARNNAGELDEAGIRELEAVSQEFKEYRTAKEARSRKLVAEIRRIVDSYKDKAEIFIGGVPMIAADMISFIQSDLIVFGSAVILFMILVLAVIFRSWKFVFIPMLCCITAVLMMLGYVSWLDWRLTVISSNFVALLLIISLSIIIHLIVRYREYLNKNPEMSKQERVENTIKFMARPCFYTAITTIVAFASLVVSDIRPVIDFGWMMTIGLVVALVLAFLILPAMLILLSDDEMRIQKNESETKQPLTLYFSRAVEKHGNLVLLGGLIVACASVWGISQLKVENKFIDYFHSTTEIYQGLSVIDNSLGGTISLDILINAPQKQVDDAEVPGFDEEDPFAEFDPFSDDAEFSDDEFAEEDPFAEDDPFSEHGDATSYWMTLSGLHKLEWLHDYLESQPEIGKVQSLAILYKVGVAINGSLNDFELALMQNSLSKDVGQVLISPYLSPDGTQARVTLRVKDSYPGLSRTELVERIKNEISADKRISSDDTTFSGLLVLYNNMLQSLFSSQILTLGAVFFAILIMLAVLFKSVFTAVIAILPNGLAAISVLGTMGILGLPLDMMTITVAAITVGIGVDHTIHYIHRYKQELQVDGSYVDAMHRSHASIGQAMYYTAVIIIFGFGIMVMSEFIPTIYFGLLTGFAMFASLMGSLLLLPKLILLAKPVKVQSN